MKKPNKKLYLALLEQRNAIDDFATAMGTASVSYMAKDDYSGRWFTLHMRDAWCNYITACVKLADLEGK